jgi:5-(carboxyamino)imidazole ribonucleotide synthase
MESTSSPSQSITPLQQIGIIGGGQLAWMMDKGARHLGLDLRIQTPHPTDPAVAIARGVVYGAIDDATATTALARQCQVITFENEFINLPALTQLEQQGTIFRPSLAALAPLLDKYDQRRYLQAHHLPTPAFVALPPNPSESDLLQLGLPAVLKARRHGYDGQGTLILRDRPGVAAALNRLHSSSGDWLLEAFVPFERELAVMVARAVDGTVVTYPVVETQQVDQICRRVLVVGDLPEAVVAQVEAIAQQLMTHLAMVGIMGIEFFLTADQQVLVNETAPRTHNSGHYTLNACQTSQFEQQLRAVSGRPLGSTALTAPGAVMVNLLGTAIPAAAYADRLRSLSRIPDSRVYWYTKEPRPGRKLGHITALCPQDTASDRRVYAQELIQSIEAIWYAQT